MYLAYALGNNLSRVATRLGHPVILHRLDKISVQKSLDAAPPTYNPPDKIRLILNFKFVQNIDKSCRKRMEFYLFYA